MSLQLTVFFWLYCLLLSAFFVFETSLKFNVFIIIISYMGAQPGYVRTGRNERMNW